ncbi:MAG TPA: hypothetical protein VGB61_07890 [Pyrinomonadaceae bacterium]
MDLPDPPRGWLFWICVAFITLALIGLAIKAVSHHRERQFWQQEAAENPG